MYLWFSHWVKIIFHEFLPNILLMFFGLVKKLSPSAFFIVSRFIFRKSKKFSHPYIKIMKSSAVLGMIIEDVEGCFFGWKIDGKKLSYFVNSCIGIVENDPFFRFACKMQIISVSLCVVSFCYSMIFVTEQWFPIELFKRVTSSFFPHPFLRLYDMHFHRANSFSSFFFIFLLLYDYFSRVFSLTSFNCWSIFAREKLFLQNLIDILHQFFKLDL